jgi:6-pyruvoyltetrahydropterin/6-carboxytetrahydropterin synthase
MVMDFGLFKPTIGEFVKSFDNAYTIWDAEPESFKNMIANHCPRVIITPTSPSAEAISLMMYHAIDAIIKNTQFNNGENANSMSLHSVRVHETTSGWAEATNKTWGNWNGWWNFGIQDIKFSDAIVKSWKDPEFWNKLVNSEPYVNPVVEQQIVLESKKPVHIELV